MRRNCLLVGLSLLQLAPLLSVACKGRQKIDEGANPIASGAERGVIPPAAEGETIKSFDLNRDDTPDVYQHYVKDAEGKERLVRKDMDVNWDGRIDILRWYDDQERLIKEDYDLDFDGRIDVTNFYDDAGKLIRKESDLDFDGRSDLWKYYEGGALVRKERDTSGDGKVDYFEYLEKGEIDRIGEDLDGDGTVDRWTKSKG